MDGLYHSFAQQDADCVWTTKHILEADEYDTESLIEDIKHYQNLLSHLNENSFQHIKQYIHDFKCMYFSLLL